VVNRLVRADPEVTARLAALAAELRGGGQVMDGARIRELTAARARLVDELTGQALDDFPAAPSALREEVTATFDAALADPEVAADLGTLVRAAHWAGFGLAPAPDGAPASPSPPPKTKKPAPVEPSAERERRRREKIQEAERAVAQADRTANAANAAEQQLEDAVRRLEAELAQARQQLADARRQAYRAESQQRRAGETLNRLRE
jgi:predicted ribosome quality control (RQC) complex YloA/Tae2 family protein